MLGSFCLFNFFTLRDLSFVVHRSHEAEEEEEMLQVLLLHPLEQSAAVWAPPRSLTAATPEPVPGHKSIQWVLEHFHTCSCFALVSSQLMSWFDLTQEMCRENHETM